MEWPVGSVIAQACHACTAATVAHLDDAHVRAYLADVDHMRKVVKECKGETQLLALADALRAAEVPHKVWLEQPVCAATANSGSLASLLCTPGGLGESVRSRSQHFLQVIYIYIS